jgi:hypothetical protein
MEMIGWTDNVRNEETLHIIKVERSILYTVKGRMAKWIGHIFGRNANVSYRASRI